MNPGTTVRPSTSTTVAAGPTAARASASLPTATIRSPCTATASAERSGPATGTTRPLRKTIPSLSLAMRAPGVVRRRARAICQRWYKCRRGDGPGEGVVPPSGRRGRADAPRRIAVSSTVKRLAALLVCGSFVIGCSAGAPATASPAASAQPPAASAPASASVAPSPSGIAAPTSLIKPGELSNCVDIEYSPMEFFDAADPTKPVGFDVESYQAVVKKLGLTEKIVNTGFDGLIPALVAKRCDIVWTALYINETRTQKADAVPYFKSSHQVMVPAGNPKGIKS